MERIKNKIQVNGVTDVSRLNSDDLKDINPEDLADNIGTLSKMLKPQD